MRISNFQNIPFIKNQTKTISKYSFKGNLQEDTLEISTKTDSTNKQNDGKTVYVIGNEYSNIMTTPRFDDFFGEMLGDIKELLETSLKTIQLTFILTAMLEPRFDSTLNRFNKAHKQFGLNMKIDELFKNSPEYSIVQDNFKEAGIVDVSQLEQLRNVYAEIKDDIKGDELEALSVYGKLDKKNDLVKYPELLICLYNIEKTKKDPNYKILNEYPRFLEEIGVNKFDEFQTKFKHLAPDFNDFNSTFDIIDAIKSIKQTYPAKIHFLEELTKRNPQINKNANAIYTQMPEFVDYFYGENNGESLDGFEDIYKIASQPKKIKGQSLKLIEAAFGDFDSTEDKVELFRFLNNYDISGNDFSIIVTENFVQRTPQDYKEELQNRPFLTKVIEQELGVKPQKSKEIYNSLSSILNSVFNENEDNTEDVKKALKMFADYKIKEPKDFLRLYKTVEGKNVKTLSKDEIKQFVELFQYTDSTDIIASSKKLKISPHQFLEREKETYLRIHQKIEEYIDSHDSVFFNGETTDNIHRKYVAAFKSIDLDVDEILDKIASEGISDNTTYNKRIESIKSLSDLFQSKCDFREFINANGISFENNPQSIEYRENCTRILEIIKSNSRTQKSFIKRANMLNETKFLPQSKNELSEFLSKLPSYSVKSDLINFIIEKEVPSIKALEAFFQTYHTKNDSETKLLEYLYKVPKDINFQELNDTLNKIQGIINSLDLPLRITADNINCIDLNDFRESTTISTNDIITLLNRMYNVHKDENFLSKLDETFEEDNTLYSANKISKEIVTKLHSNPHTYQNIIRLLHLDKQSLKLPQQASQNRYIDVMAANLPKEFIDFINTKDWFSFSTIRGEKIPNISLHSRMRAIDRFALDSQTQSIEELYTPETKMKMKQLFSNIYSQRPTNIEGRKSSKRIVVDYDMGGNTIEAVFNPHGILITLVKTK